MKERRRDTAPKMLGSEEMFADSIAWQVWLAAEMTYERRQESDESKESSDG